MGVVSGLAGTDQALVVSYLRPGFRQLYRDAYHIPGSLITRLADRPPSAPLNAVSEWQSAQGAARPAARDFPAAPSVPGMPGRSSTLPAAPGAEAYIAPPPAPLFLQGDDGYIYVRPSQRPVGVFFSGAPAIGAPADEPRGVFLQQADAMRAFAAEALPAPQYILQEGPVFVDDIAPVMREASLKAIHEERVAGRRDQAVPSGVTSIGAPAGLSEPVFLKGPTTVSGPSFTVSGPPLPLNRRLDTLGRGSLPESDLDGPFDTRDNRALHAMWREGGDRAFLQGYSTRQAAYAGEDDAAFAYQRLLQAGDAEFAQAAQDVDRLDTSRAFHYAQGLAESNQRAADVEYYEYQSRLGVDMSAAYAYSRQADEAGFAETGVPLHVRPSKLLAAMPEFAAEGIPPVDVARAEPDAVPTAGFYPLDRPADAAFAPPAPTPLSHNYLEHPPLPAAVNERLGREARGQSPAQHGAAEQPVRHAEAEPSSRFQPTGLQAMALAPLSIGVSFTV